MKAADLIVEELQALIKKTLHEELQELFTDPDTERELTQKMEARLASSLPSTERVPFEEMKRLYTFR
jgi:predicted house-cleaning noncanonical NTP pyrophosphatase (MazG superfamily)